MMGSVTSSGGPPLPSPTLGNPVALGQFQYFRCYCVRHRLGFSDSVIMILAYGPTRSSRM